MYGKKTPAKKRSCYKMKASSYDNNPMKKNFPTALKFNSKLKAASAAGKLDDSPKFKAAVDASPAKKYVSDAQRKAVHASKADGGKGAPAKMYDKKSPAKMYKNKRNKSNKPCTGCKSICPSCRG